MPVMMSGRRGRYLHWTPEEDAVLIQRHKDGHLFKDIANDFGIKYKAVHRRAVVLGIARRNGATISRILREEFHKLEKLAKEGKYSREDVMHMFNISRNYADILHDVIILIQARDAVKQNIGIDAVITPRGRLKQRVV